MQHKRLQAKLANARQVLAAARVNHATFDPITNKLRDKAAGD